MNTHDFSALKLRIGTRGSRLALVQVEEILSLLAENGVRLQTEKKIYRTQGDRDKTTSLLINPADNFFTDTIDTALLNKEIDIAVHSAKDLPKVLKPGLKVFALTASLDETDAFVGHDRFENLKAGARVGTSSVLRRDMMKKMNPDFTIVDIRGTIEERLALVDQGTCDGVIVATCALKRLGLDHLIRNIMPWEATALQGQLAVVGRTDDLRLAELFAPLDVRAKYGRVTLVGAGPGDPELITLKGIRALRAADCIFYDYLVDPKLLENAPQAEKIYAGKRKGSHAMPQSELSRMLREKAAAGKNVVRLKGGDPLVFGRGADEIEYLRSYHIEVDVIPGVSSATGIPSLLGIPLTARGISSSIAFLSGHSDEEEHAPSDWIGIPKADTLIFLMGLTKLPSIVSSLKKAGWKENTPVVVISRGTRPDEKIVSATIATIEDEVLKEKIEPPALIVVGEVVRFYRQGNFSEGRTLYLGTHPEKYRPLGEIVHVPMIQINPVSINPKQMKELFASMDHYRMIIFTSRFAVKFFLELLQENDYAIENLKTKDIAVIGRETAAALGEFGLKPSIIPSEETGEGLFKAISAHQSLKGLRILFPRSSLPNPFLKMQLIKEGAEVTEVTVYENVPSPQKDFLNENIRKVIFTSPSTVKNFLDTYGVIPKHWQIFSKGPRTSEALREAGYESEVLIYDKAV